MNICICTTSTGRWASSANSLLFPDGEVRFAYKNGRLPCPRKYGNAIAICAYIYKRVHVHTIKYYTYHCVGCIRRITESSIPPPPSYVFFPGNTPSHAFSSLGGTRCCRNRRGLCYVPTARFGLSVALNNLFFFT